VRYFCVLILICTGCSSVQKKQDFKDQELAISIKIEDGARFGNTSHKRSRLKTDVSLKPQEKTRLGGIITQPGGEETIYYIKANPTDEVVEFTIFRGQTKIGMMQLLRKDGEEGEMQNATMYQRIVLLKTSRSRRL